MRKNLGRSFALWRTSTSEGASCMRQPNWRKSTYSGGGGSDCVEVAFGEWRTSSYSGGGGSNCVQVAFGQVAAAVRDSKNTTGPELRFSASSWLAFIRQNSGS